MLRKILTITLILALFVTFGCKKKEAQPAAGTTTSAIQKQAEKTGEEAKKQAEAAKEKAGKELEKTGKELQKDVNAE